MKDDSNTPAPQAATPNTMLGEALGTVKTMDYTLRDIYEKCKEYADAPNLSKKTAMAVVREVEALAEAELFGPNARAERTAKEFKEAVPDSQAEAPRPSAPYNPLVPSSRKSINVDLYVYGVAESRPSAEEVEKMAHEWLSNEIADNSTDQFREMALLYQMDMEDLLRDFYQWMQER
jgi:hypothetical protein